jgi:hypothetical protein
VQDTNEKQEVEGTVPSPTTNGEAVNASHTTHGDFISQLAGQEDLVLNQILREHIQLQRDEFYQESFGQNETSEVAIVPTHPSNQTTKSDSLSMSAQPQLPLEFDRAVVDSDVRFETFNLPVFPMNYF